MARLIMRSAGGNYASLATNTSGGAHSRSHMSRFQATALVVVGLALLGYFFLADQIYLWVVTNEIGVMLHPASRGSCAYPALWMPFEGALALTPSSSHAPGFPPSTFLSPDHTSNIASHDGPSQGASRVTLVAV